MTSSKSEVPELVQDAQKLVEEQYPYLQGSSDLAELLQVSPEHLIRQCKKHLGISPTQYLIQHKLEKSKHLLLTDNLYVDTVANLVGFSSGNYFSKVFRKHYGISPTEYIAENKGNPPQEEFPELYV